MDDQGEFDFTHRARRTDPKTSHIAAAGSSHKPVRYEKILAALKLMEDGGTCYELARATSMTHVQVARCMKPMEQKGWLPEHRCRIVRTNNMRLGDTGHPCTVWRVSEQAP